MERWQGKVALVTGASAGIGLDICKAFAKEGLIVVGCARRTDRLKNLGKDIASSGGSFLGITCDLTKEDNIVDMFSKIKETYGGVDICINNAGGSANSGLMDGKLSEWKKMMDLNVLALCLCTQLSIKSMQERKFDGHIININSIAGHQVLGSKPLRFYCATKFAVTALTKGFRQELMETNSRIRLTSVSPGVVKTEIMSTVSGQDISDRFFTNLECIQPEDISKIVIDVLSTHPRAEITEVTVVPSAIPNTRRDYHDNFNYI